VNIAKTRKATVLLLRDDSTFDCTTPVARDDSS